MLETIIGLKLKKEKSFLLAFAGTAGLQLFGRGLAVVTAILFARILGPEEYGRYAFIISIITVSALPAMAGLPQLIVREVARYRSNYEIGLLFGIKRWSTIYVLVLSLISISILVFLIYIGFWNASVTSLLFAGLLLIPLKGLLPQQGAILNGFQRPELAQLPTLIISPLLTLISIFVLYVSMVEMNAKVLLLTQLFCTFCTVVLIFILINLVFKESHVDRKKREYRLSSWQKSLLPFTVLAVVGTLNNELATLVLGFLGNDEAIGYFKVAVQGVTLLAIGLQAVNTVSGPRIAAMYNQGEIEKTQELLKQSVRLSVISSVPFAILLIFLGEPLIRVLFGEAYVPAASLLSILCCGQIVNVSMGSVALVLNMTGNEKKTLRAQLVTLCLTVSLLVYLIPLYHATGAAIAVSVSLVCWNVIMAFDVYRLTGLKTWLRF
ncbi:flippase [Vibrio sp. 10N.222.54.B12]|uniref:flippase n=1 Tax=Vibrio sp. 10N.222.54.B12 TaxID=3229636 RepID=UPI00354C3F9A